VVCCVMMYVVSRDCVVLCRGWLGVGLLFFFVLCCCVMCIVLLLMVLGGVPCGVVVYCRQVYGVGFRSVVLRCDVISVSAVVCCVSCCCSSYCVAVGSCVLL